MTLNIDAANERSRRLRELIRAPGILVMPGAYDTLSAQLFESMGFQAIQGSSGAVAAALGYADGEVISRDQMVDVYRNMVEAVSVPVNADGEKGYGKTPADVGETVGRLVEAGASGMNLEDSAPHGRNEPMTLIDLDAARERVAAVIEARRRLGSEFFLNARVDAFMAISNPEEALEEAIRRGNAYAELGADCIFYIRAGGPETIGTLVKEVKAPVSILAGPTSPSVAELERLGVARVSYGTSFLGQALVRMREFAEVVLAKGDPAELLSQGYPGAELARIVRSERR